MLTRFIKHIVDIKIKMNNLKVCRYCSLKSCKVTTKEQVSMFEWPSDQETRDKWKVFLLKNGNKNCEKVLWVRLCEYHFRLDDIIITAKVKRLKKGSVPVYNTRRVNIQKKNSKFLIIIV